MAKPRLAYATCRECGHQIVWLKAPGGRRLPPHEYVGVALTVDDDGLALSDQPVFVRHHCREQDIVAHSARKVEQQEIRERGGHAQFAQAPLEERREAAWEQALPRACSTCHVPAGEFCVNLSPKARPGQEKQWPHPTRRI